MFGDKEKGIDQRKKRRSGEVQQAIPILQKAYGDSMHKVLHVGPDSCYVVSKLLKEEETEAWGIEPYDIEEADSSCKALIHRGSVRVSDIKFPLPYRPKSFSLVIVSDALDYLSPRYLNKTLPDLVRVASDGVVIFTAVIESKSLVVIVGVNHPKYDFLLPVLILMSCWELASNNLMVLSLTSDEIYNEGFPTTQKAKVADVSKFGRAAKMRSSSWWSKFFLQINLEENEAASKKFEQASTQSSYIPKCQIFHLNSLH
ncbi:hypothetical protein V8G54_037001 [Vigna mungo]|uniref:Uncharacterized protein n=1 Tax=Vigna mungo TaxID=3915 RepID=A0AAQ3MI34_VIGMU